MKLDRISHRTEHVAYVVGHPRRRHPLVERDQARERRGEQPPVGGPLNGVAEAHAARGHFPHPTAHPHEIVIPRRLPIAQGRFVHREPVPPRLEVTIAQASLAQILGSSDIEPDKIARVIDDTHLIGLGVVHPDLHVHDPGSITLHCLPHFALGPIFGAVLGHQLVVVSDAHLGVTPPAIEETLLAFLDAVPTLGDCLLINGDLFDFWFGYSRVIPRHGFHVVAALAQLRRRLPIVMIGGNHDRWGRDFWDRDLNIEFAPFKTHFAIGRRRVLALHGDGLTELRRRAVLLHRLINHPITAGIYRALHPDLGFKLVDLMSPMLGDGPPDERIVQQAAERQQAWAERALLDEPALGLVVMGHTHRAALSSLSPGRQYLNPGAWFDGFRYAIATETDAALRQFGVRATPTSV